MFITAAVALVIAGLAVPDRFGRNRSLTAVCVLAAVLVIVRHRSNIERLFRGTERRIGGGSGDAQKREGGQ